MLMPVVVIAGDLGDVIACIQRSMEFVVFRFEFVGNEMPDTPNARQRPDNREKRRPAPSKAPPSRRCERAARDLARSSLSPSTCRLWLHR